MLCSGIDGRRQYAAELVALAPDVILARAGSTVAPLQQATRTVPIVFAQAADPVGAGFVASLVRPSGNARFTQFEYGLVESLELRKEIAPRVTRAVVLRDSTNPAGTGQWAVSQAMAASIGVAAKRACGWTAGKLPCIVEPNKPGRGEKETREAI